MKRKPGGGRPPRRFEGAGWALFCGLVLFALLRAALVAGPPAPRRLTAQELRDVGRAAARAEPGWRKKSQQSFPFDRWSQDDDTANAERSWVRDEANRRGAHETDIWRAIDEDLRRHTVTPPRSAASAPAKPRPFYD